MSTETAADSSVVSDEPSFDMDGAVSQLSDSLFPHATEEAAPDVAPAEPETEPVAEAVAPAVPTPPVAAAEAPPAPVREAPKSWTKEMREHWAALPAPVQDYWHTRERQMLDGLGQYKTDATFGRSLKDVLTPYTPMLTAHGMTEAQAVQTLLNAQYRLTQGPEAARQAAYRELGRNLGFVEADPEAPPPDPQVQALTQRLTQMEAALTTQRQAEIAQVRQTINQEVDRFATDAAHPYFDDVAETMLPFLQAGQSLQDAYEQAVWANPVTRQKEFGKREAQQAAALKDQARRDAQVAQHATRANVRSRAAVRASTEPVGSMVDTMKQTLAEIQARP